MGAKKTFGTVLKLADSGSAVAAVAELFSIKMPGLTRGTVDATTHDSPGGAMEYIPEGVYDAGEIQCQGHYVAGSTADDLLIAALVSGTVQDFEIVAKSAAGTETISGSAIVTAYEPDGMEVQGKQTFSATLKVTGALTQAPTA